jgi:flavin reductase (DIM6/NTAB) family NADH-FMN oxidoreductase RutF
MKVDMAAFRPVYPTPAALITSVAADGRPNILALGEVFNLSLGKPPIVGIAIHKARYSHQLISEAGQFVVNMATTRLVEQVDLCGTTSGREVDKFALTGLTPVPASQVKPPLIAECPINLECVVLGIEEIGDHDLFKGQVLLAHVDDSLLDAEGRVCVERLDTLVFMFNMNYAGEYWSLGEKIAPAWHTRKPRATK